jgi:hypothetical protein
VTSTIAKSPVIPRITGSVQQLLAFGSLIAIWSSSPSRAHISSRPAISSESPGGDGDRHPGAGTTFVIISGGIDLSSVPA